MTNGDLVKAASDAFARGDLQAILDMCTDGVEVIAPGPTTIPFTGRWAGKDRVTEYFASIAESLDMQKWHLDHYVASGDRVAAFGVMISRGRATGKTLDDSPWALDVTVANGKITGWQVYMDTAAVEKHLA
jgi:ketosteroid isomerase-like protein